MYLRLYYTRVKRTTRTILAAYFSRRYFLSHPLSRPLVHAAVDALNRSNLQERRETRKRLYLEE